MRARWVKRGVKVGMIGVMSVAVFGFLVTESVELAMAPAVSGLRLITFWQAIGILILSKILFGGFRGRPGYRAHWENAP